MGVLPEQVKLPAFPHISLLLVPNFLVPKLLFGNVRSRNSFSRSKKGSGVFAEPGYPKRLPTPIHRGLRPSSFLPPADRHPTDVVVLPVVPADQFELAARHLLQRLPVGDLLALTFPERSEQDGGQVIEPILERDGQRTLLRLMHQNPLAVTV